MAQDMDKLSVRLDRLVDAVTTALKGISDANQKISTELSFARQDITKIKEFLSGFQTQSQGMANDLKRTASDIYKMSQQNDRLFHEFSETKGRLIQLGNEKSVVQMSSGIVRSQNKGVTLAQHLKNENSLFDARILNAFITSTREVFKSLLREEIHFSKPSAGESLSVPYDFIVKTNLQREGQGAMIGLAFTQDVLFDVVRCFFGISDRNAVGLKQCEEVCRQINTQILECSKKKLLAENTALKNEVPVFLNARPDEIEKKLGSPHLVLRFERRQFPFFIVCWG